MELVIFGVLNVVLLVLLLVAFKLIRSGGSARTGNPAPSVDHGTSVREQVDDVVEPPSQEPQTDEDVIDLRETPGSKPTMPLYGDAVFADDGTPLPEGAFEPPSRAGAADGSPLAIPAPPAQGSGPLTGVSRSAIVVDSTMNGTGPTPSELLFSVIETLGSIGFELTKESPDYGLLKDADGNTASIDLTKRPNGSDRIAIAVDSPRAVEALAMLEIWHRSGLGATDQVRLSARIR